MNHIIDRQTFIFSINMNAFVQIQTPLNLRFAADELILKSIVYNTRDPNNDSPNVVQIWCNITNDNLIGVFPNNAALCQQFDSHFRINNAFQTGNFVLQFQQTGSNAGPIFYNPHALIGNSTNGIVAITIEFVKYAK